MKQIWIITQKEWLFLVKNPVGYIFAGLLMVVSAWMYFYNFFVLGQLDLTPYWTTLIFLLAIFIPAISMNLLADEKKQGNWEMLLSLPVNELQIVLGKFFGSFIYLLVTMLLSLPLIITLVLLGKPDLGIIFSQFLGTLLLGGSYLAVGIWFSGMTAQPIVAFLTTAVALIISNLANQSEILSRLPNSIQNILIQISLAGRTDNFLGGLIRVNDLVFMASWIVVFLTLAVLSLKARNK